MALRTEKVLVGPDEYEITQLTAVEGRRIYVRLVNLLGPSVEALGRTEELEAGVGVALGRLLSSLRDDDMDALCNAFAKSSRVRINGNLPLLSEPGIFDTHFSGRYLAMTRWLFECVRLNFADFFTGLPPRLAALLKEATKGITGDAGTDASTGGSGESSPPST